MNYGEDPMMDYGKDPYKDKDDIKNGEEYISQKKPTKRAREDKMEVDRKAEESEEGEIAE